MVFTCSAHFSGKADIHPKVSCSHGGIGVIINPACVVGERCIIGSGMMPGNRFPHGGAPKLGRYVYVGVGAKILGGVQLADYVVVGANSIITKDILEEGMVIAGVPARVIRKLTEEEKNMMNW